MSFDLTKLYREDTIKRMSPTVKETLSFILDELFKKEKKIGKKLRPGADIKYPIGYRDVAEYLQVGLKLSGSCLPIDDDKFVFHHHYAWNDLHEEINISINLPV